MISGWPQAAEKFAGDPILLPLLYQLNFHHCFHPKFHWHFYVFPQHRILQLQGPWSFSRQPGCHENSKALSDLYGPKQRNTSATTNSVCGRDCFMVWKCTCFHPFGKIKANEGDTGIAVSRTYLRGSLTGNWWGSDLWTPDFILWHWHTSNIRTNEPRFTLALMCFNPVWPPVWLVCKYLNIWSQISGGETSFRSA